MAAKAPAKKRAAKKTPAKPVKKAAAKRQSARMQVTPIPKQKASKATPSRGPGGVGY